MLYNPKVDFVNDNVYTNFGLNLFICFQDIEQILASIKGQNTITNLQKMTGNNPNIDLVNINVYTKFGKIL